MIKHTIFEIIDDVLMRTGEMNIPERNRLMWHLSQAIDFDCCLAGTINIAVFNQDIVELTWLCCFKGTYRIDIHISRREDDSLTLHVFGYIMTENDIASTAADTLSGLATQADVGFIEDIIFSRQILDP